MTDAPVRCAVYARYSSEMQKSSSIEDQVRECTAYITRQGWQLADGQIYEDRAVSGSVVGRAGYQALKHAARYQSFDFIVVDDLSRLGRDTLESLTAFRELTNLGVNIVGVSDGINTANRGSKLPYYFKSMMNDIFLDDMREKVMRGLKGRAHNGFSTGGRVYGYRYVEIADPSGAKDKSGRPKRLGVKVEIDEGQANVVRQIFELRIKGMGLRGICKRLNNDGIPSPRFALRGTGDRTWSLGTIIGIVKQVKYKGDWTWNKHEWRKIPGSEKRLKRLRPESEWVKCQREDLRIVSDEVWAKAQPRESNNGTRDPHRRAQALAHPEVDNRGKFLLSGLLQCSVCGGNLIAMSDRGASAYTCNKHWSRGDTACTNKLRVSRAWVERTVLREIKRHFLDPKVVMRLVRELQTRLRALRQDPADEIKEKKAEAHRLEREIANLTGFVIAGDSSESVRAALADRESALRGVCRDLDLLKARQGDKPLDVSEAWVTEKLAAFRELLNYKREKLPLIRVELRRLLGDQITMTPTGEGKGRHYVATVRGRPLAILGDLPGVSQAPNVRSATGIRTPGSA